MSEESGNILDLGSIDFTPAWARKEAGVSIGKVRPERDAARGARDGDRGAKRPFGDGAPRGFGPAGKKPFQKKPFAGRPRFEDRPKPLDVDIKILPETKALGTIIRKLQNDVHAYKLKDLAYFFLDNPSSVLLRITPKADRFFQCKACGFASTREEDVLDHAVGAHLGDYYDSKEVDCEPPKGRGSEQAECQLPQRACFLPE